MQEERRTCLALNFFKKMSYLGFFLNLVPKESFAPKARFSIKLIGYSLEARWSCDKNWPGRRFMLRQVFGYI